MSYNSSINIWYASPSLWLQLHICGAYWRLAPLLPPSVQYPSLLSMFLQCFLREWGGRGKSAFCIHYFDDRSVEYGGTTLLRYTQIRIWVASSESDSIWESNRGYSRLSMFRYRLYRTRIVLFFRCYECFQCNPERPETYYENRLLVRCAWSKFG